MIPPSDNPFHQGHIEEYTKYTDASVNSLAAELQRAIPAIVDHQLAKTKVQMDVDAPSMKRVKSKLNELFNGFGRWGR